MGQPVVHFEIIGKEPAKLRSYFGELFGWETDRVGPTWRPGLPGLTSHRTLSGATATM